MAVHLTHRARHHSAIRQNRGLREKSSKATNELAALPSLSHADLKHQWKEAFGTTPPKGLSRRLMIHALAYDLQTQHMGRLRPSVRQDLREIAALTTSQSSITAPAKLTPGTRLMREWRGTVHVVDVTENGLVWNGRVYASLSAIARTITGTRWSGQRFFGLRKRSDAVDASKTAQARASSDEALQIAAPQTDEPLCSNEQGAENSASLDNIMEVATSGPPSIDPEPETVS